MQSLLGNQTLKMVQSEDEGKERKSFRDSPRLYLLGPRHIDSQHYYEEELPPWRLKDRMKTVSVALVLCLNLNVDPPDIIKTKPCARLECWFDPQKCNLATKPIKQIGNKLQKQYETWQRRARYKQSHDPTIEELKNLCISLRRNAKEERVLFHYNGHGVPRPTDKGEIWVFNSNYTQYIPLSVYELQQWLTCPSIYVYDCSNAGVLLKHFNSQGVWKNNGGSDGGDSGTEGEVPTTAAEQPSSPSSQSVQPPPQHGAAQQQQHPADPQADRQQQQQHPASGGVRQSSRQVADFGPVHPVNPHLIAGNPNFQANNVPGQENVNFNTNLGPNMGQPIESGCSTPQPSVFGESIHLCACGEGELLPMCPELPADVFTACLTTPITMAVRWFLLQHCAYPPPLHIADKIPGELHDRRTVLGELNWVFTAITDTIAWNVLPLERFQKLFRQDLLVASLFRNFLLAERIMRGYGCCPVSLPRLPPTHCHSMWQSWDLSLQHCLTQLWPSLAFTLGGGSNNNSYGSYSNSGNLDARSGSFNINGNRGAVTSRLSALNNKQITRNGKDQQFIIHPSNLQGLQLPFFQCQLSAFQAWLKLPHRNREPPEQLPVLLQVLLSQVYRPLALELLCTFLSLGRWAVHLVLSVGIFPYILKLLQSTSRDLRPALVTLWAKILAVEQSCKADLIRDSGYQYFLHVLADTTMQAEHRGLAAFILAVMVSNDPENQRKALQANIIPTCLEQISNTTLPGPYDEVNNSYDYEVHNRHDMHAEASVRMWPVVCLAATWHNNPDVRWSATRDNAPEKLYPLLLDPVPEVRCACIYALGSFMSSLPVSDQSEQGKTINHSIAVTLVNTCLHYDAAPTVRMELAVALQLFVLLYENSFIQLVSHLHSDMDSLTSSMGSHTLNASMSSISSRSSSRSILSGEPCDASLLSPSGARISSSSAGGISGMHRAASALTVSSPGSSWSGSLLSSSGMYARIWQALLTLTRDPHPPVSALASKITNFVLNKTRQSATLPRRSSGSTSSTLDDPFDLSSCVTFGSFSSSGCHGDSSLAEYGLPAPRHRPSSSVYNNDQFIRPLVSSPLSMWSSQLLVTPVYCPADTPPTSAFFVARKDLLLLRTALKTPCDKPANVRLLPAATETRLLQDLQGSKDATPKRGRARAKLDNEVLNERLPSLPSVLLFHPSAPHLVVCEKAYVSSYNLESSELVNRWLNHQVSSQRITSACVINDACETPLLAVASDEGSVRVWSNPFFHTRTHIKNYATKDPYFKTQWLEAQSNTGCSKSSKCDRETDPNWETLKTGWRRRGGNLMIGNSFVGDNIGGFLGEGCHVDESRDRLTGGFFAKGYGWQSHSPLGRDGVSPTPTSTPSPSGSTSSSGWSSSPWSSSGGGAAPAPTPVNGWAIGGSNFLEPRRLDMTRVRPKIVAAFSATTYVRPGMKGPGPLLSWCQETGQLAVAGGEHRTIRLWDLRTELHAGDLLHTASTATSYASCITALHTQGVHIAAGCSDGSVLLLDSRVGLVMPSVGGVSNRSSSGGRSVRERSIVHDWKEDASWVVCAHLFSDYSIMAGSVSGVVRVLDLRNRSSSLLLQTPSEITAMAVNERHRLFAVGTVAQTLSVHTADGGLVNTMQVNEGFLAQRASPVAAIAFHASRPLLAAATNDKTVSVYGLQLR